MISRCLFIAFFILTSITFLYAQEKGNASYYHSRFHGRRTASGVRYHKDSMTCAHRTYPFGTLLLIENTQNNKKVIVKVIDRGPYSKKFTIDLSHKAAKQLDFIKQGYAPVKITPYKPTPLLYESLDAPLYYPHKKNTPFPKSIRNEVKQRRRIK